MTPQQAPRQPITIPFAAQIPAARGALLSKTNLKSYAPQTRKDFIAAVTARDHLLALDDHNGQLTARPASPGRRDRDRRKGLARKVKGQRQQLIARMQREGFAQTVEAVAYS